MANLTIKNIPPEVHELLRARAKANGRSLNSEIIMNLRLMVMKPQRDPEKTLARLKEIRKLFKGPPMTQEEIRNSIREGRM